MSSEAEFEMQPRDVHAAGAPDEVSALREALLEADEEQRLRYEELAAVRLELETATARNAYLLGDSPAAYVVTDPAGVIVDANQAAWALFGQAAPGGRVPVATMFPPTSRQAVRALVSRASVVGEPQNERVTIDQDGRPVELRVHVQLRTEPRSGAALLSWELVPVDASALLRLVAESETSPDGSTGELPRLLSLARADLAAVLSPDDEPEVLLARAVELTRRWIPHAEHASVVIRPRGGPLRSAAASDDVASGCDQAQIDVDEGPVLDVMADHQPRRTDDLRDEPRWPQLAARASIALAHADRVFNLRRAVESRQLIGQAVGILMERHKIDEDDAFERLVAASQQRHLKVRELAERITETGEEPEQVVP